MKLVLVAALVAVCAGDKLNRAYLPPPSAATAGGSPGSLQAPLTRHFNQGLGGLPRSQTSEQTQDLTRSQSNDALPQGSYTNEHQGVVVDAAAAGTRATSSEQSGLGGPRVSYGSSDSKVGGAAFVRQQTGQAGFRGPGQSVINNQPERIQAARDRAANTVRLVNEVGPESFNYAFETDNGIAADENGLTINGVQAQGGYSYTGDDGQVYSVTYTADEGGYQPKGEHLPTPPPIPDEILKSLEQNAKEEAAGLVDDGSYHDEKYNTDEYKGDSINGFNDRQSNLYGNPSDADASGTFINQNQASPVFGKPSNQFGKPTASGAGSQASNRPDQFQTQYNGLKPNQYQPESSFGNNRPQFGLGSTKPSFEKDSSQPDVGISDSDKDSSTVVPLSQQKLQDDDEKSQNVGPHIGSASSGSGLKPQSNNAGFSTSYGSSSSSSSISSGKPTENSNVFGSSQYLPPTNTYRPGSQSTPSYNQGIASNQISSGFNANQQTSNSLSGNKPILGQSQLGVSSFQSSAFGNNQQISKAPESNTNIGATQQGAFNAQFSSAFNNNQPGFNLPTFSGSKPNLKPTQQGASNSQFSSTFTNNQQGYTSPTLSGSKPYFEQSQQSSSNSQFPSTFNNNQQGYTSPTLSGSKPNFAQGQQGTSNSQFPSTFNNNQQGYTSPTLSGSKPNFAQGQQGASNSQFPSTFNNIQQGLSLPTYSGSKPNFEQGQQGVSNSQFLSSFSNNQQNPTLPTFSTPKPNFGQGTTNSQFGNFNQQQQISSSQTTGLKPNFGQSTPQGIFSSSIPGQNNNQQQVINSPTHSGLKPTNAQLNHQSASNSAHSMFNNNNQHIPSSQAFSGSKPSFGSNQFNNLQQSSFSTNNNNGVTQSSGQSGIQTQTQLQIGSSFTGLDISKPQGQFGTFSNQKPTLQPDTELTTPLETSGTQSSFPISSSSSSVYQSASLTTPSGSSFNKPSQASGTSISSQFGLPNSKPEVAPTSPTTNFPTFSQSTSAFPTRPTSAPFGGQSQSSFFKPQSQTQSFGSSQPQPSFGNQPHSQFSQNQPDVQYSPSTQRPSYSQYTQPQGPDDSYIYNTPSKPFNTPSRLPSSPSSQFNRVTQPSFTQSQFNTQGSSSQSTAYPRPTAFPSIPTRKEDQNYQTSAFTQASVSPFASVTPTMSSNFNNQFNSKPFQQSPPKFDIQGQPSPTSLPSFAQVSATVQRPGSQAPQQPSFGQASNEISKPLDASAQSTQQYTGEIYEYNKPPQSLPAPQKETTESSQSPQTITQGQFGQFSNQFTTNQFAPRPTQPPQITTQFGSQPNKEISQSTQGESQQFESGFPIQNSEESLSAQPQQGSGCCKETTVTTLTKLTPSPPGDQNNNFGQNFGQNAFYSQGTKPSEANSQFAGITEMFGGSRKPPSFDESGYHY